MSNNGAPETANITVAINPADDTEPEFFQGIDGLYVFTGDKTQEGTTWKFQVAVADDDAASIGQGGIAEFDVYNTTQSLLLGSATYNPSTEVWTGSGQISFPFVTWDIATGVYTITVSNNNINNHNTIEVIAYDLAHNSNSVTGTLTNSSNFQVAPAGIAGEPINLGLTSPENEGGLITATIKDLPSGWTLDGATQNQDASWTVQTADVGSLTITTSSDFAGAFLLPVTLSWTNADGTTATTTVADNIEAYTPGSPIFAWSGDDVLTGSSGQDLYVFAQPIGNDVVHSFDVGQDQIDLIGYAGFTSFADVQAHLSNNAAGDAVITLGDGQSITILSVPAAALTAGNFVFDQTPVTDNAGTMTIGDGAMLPLSGTFDNSGTVALNSNGDQTELQIVGSGLTLQGGGQIVLSDSSANAIVGTNPADTLTNIDNTISGAGQIGSGDGSLTLVNGASGIIAANVNGTTLTLDTGAPIVNNGILEAMNGGTLRIDDPLSGSGWLAIGVGVLELAALCAADVLFSTTADAYGTLSIDYAADFTGTIYNFAGTSAQSSDAIDLKDIAYQGASVSYSDDSGTDTGGTLTIYDASHTVVDAIKFATGEFQTANFNLADDGHGGTLITDPAISITTSSISTTLTSGADAVTFDDNNNTHQVSATDQTLANGDKIIGGDGTDTLTVDNGNGDNSYTFGDGDHFDIGLTGFENLKLTDADATSDHAITVAFDASFDNNGLLTVDGSALSHLNGSGVTIDAHLASDSFAFIGSSNGDTLIGGTQADTITGGGGGDSLTGGGSSDTFMFKATTDSQPGAGQFDTITDFTANSDHLDIAAISGLNSDNQAVDIQTLTLTPAEIAAHTIAILTNGGNTVIYANASDALESIGSADMEIHLNNVTNVQSTDFILYH